MSDGGGCVVQGDIIQKEVFPSVYISLMSCFPVHQDSFLGDGQGNQENFDIIVVQRDWGCVAKYAEGWAQWDKAAKERGKGESDIFPKLLNGGAVPEGVDMSVWCILGTVIAEV